MLEFVRLLSKGGPVMVPLLACSLISLAVIIERAIVFRRAGAGTESLMRVIRQRYRQGDGREALAACERTPGPVAAVLASGLREASHNGHMVDAMEEQALAELPHLTRRLVALDTIVTIAPLLGLLGTVWGMINSFHVLARSGVSRPSGITAGIAEALIATATGLVIAIFTLVAYNYFQDKVKQITGEIEMRSTQLSNLVSRRSEEPARAPAAQRV
ncbi:hypothetical protein AMK68_02125 [candidate division KD3-62 bacterium DG_56]|uniref:MotA/TolQ/ExbB proton channel domain-containing protein n=1 Tax=candidate division KD3-62 bacterium DG_56 TaxID=1704032 RepID=A0A0S7XNX9_9BACT|nr:MAG: hypothetical protein AMK68_02125 [candidate division KD3-62 bacterium DG_56]